MFTVPQIILMVSGLIGGLALFLYGMSTMSDCLTQTIGILVSESIQDSLGAWLDGNFEEAEQDSVLADTEAAPQEKV